MNQDLHIDYAPDKAPDLELAIRRAKAEILSDVANRRVPLDVASFAELHDYVDANEYGGLCTEEFSAAARHLTGEHAEVRFAEALQRDVDQWVKAGGVRAEALRVHLAANYSALTFEVCSKQDMQVQDYEDAPDLLVVVSSGDGPGIVDPLSSECSRFPVNPEEAYGLSFIDATLIRQHNRVAMADAPADMPRQEPMSGDTISIFERVKAAMQEAEEVYGPTRWEYVALMSAIASEAAQRAANCRTAMKGPDHG